VSNYRLRITKQLHGCGGSGPTYFKQVKFNQYADKLGFVVIYPSATHDYNCWDAATNATLTHNGGGDSLALVNMVKYTLQKYNGDPKMVFATGSSSGGIMSNVLAGAYPGACYHRANAVLYSMPAGRHKKAYFEFTVDLFAAISPFSGMPYACLLGSPASSPQAADEWAALVQAGYPGYTGPRPRMQIWHGKADLFVSYTNLKEQIKEWSTVLDVPFTKNETDSPLKGYTKMVFGDGTKMVAYSAEGVGHVVPTDEEVVLKWFGIM
jgi:acetylxylan esterase